MASHGSGQGAEALDPLERDVHDLERLLSEVLESVGEPGLCAEVEQARRAAERRRAGDAQAGAELEALLVGLPPRRAARVTRAFSAYFGAVNMAEQVHRIRRGRDYDREDRPQRGSLRAVLGDAARRGFPLAELRAVLERMRLVPVFTAHPTRATRRTQLAKEQRIARALIDRIDPERLTPSEARAVDARIRAELATAWQTEEHLAVKPSVADEAEHVLFYLADVIYRVVPPFYESLEAAVREAYGSVPWPIPRILRFASWVGGDMDGNPSVSGATIRSTLARQRELVLRRYRTEVRELFGRLSHAQSHVAVDAAVLERVAQYSALLPAVAAAIPERYLASPYRRLLWLVDARLEATESRGLGAYLAVGDLCADLRLIAQSLRRHDGTLSGLFHVERLLRRVETFGFHLATLDVRQDALVHRRAVGLLLGRPDFTALSAVERLGLLEQALSAGEPFRPTDDPELSRTLDVMAAIGECRAEHGAEAVGPYIISMAQGPDDALALLVLARAGGLRADQGTVPLDIAPLFETIADLASAPDTMARLLAHPIYRGHLAARGGEQIVMLGYSDSNKVGGLLASRVALHRVQRELLEVARGAEIRLSFFHGRGGTAGRGGSKPREAILGEPAGAVQGCWRLTEQGEIIHAKYGMRPIALRTLELMAGALIEATGCIGGACHADPQCDEILAEAAGAGLRCYGELVADNPDLVSYFRLATPIDVIERLRIGSRPASRREARSVEDLRAIPWVFAWTQSRHLLPGWYGVGSGLGQAIERHGLETLREMRSRSAFFANLVSDVEMVLAKADLEIAARYASLAADVGDRVFPIIAEEFERTRRVVLAIQDEQELLDREPVLRRNIRLRNPYVDPMSLAQIDLLARWRATERTDVALEEALVLTVIGIARGLQNTG